MRWRHASAQGAHGQGMGGWGPPVSDERASAAMRGAGGGRHVRCSVHAVHPSRNVVFALTAPTATQAAPADSWQPLTFRLVAVNVHCRVHRCLHPGDWEQRHDSERGWEEAARRGAACRCHGAGTLPRCLCAAACPNNSRLSTRPARISARCPRLYHSSRLPHLPASAHVLAHAHPNTSHPAARPACLQVFACVVLH